MNWYEGTMAEAVNLSKQRNTIFVVFVEGDDDSSKLLASKIDNSKILKRLSDPKNFLAVKLKSGSENYTYFAQIYQFVPVPSLFFIGRNGTPLEVVCATVDTLNLGNRIDKILQEHHNLAFSPDSEDTTSEPSTSSLFVEEESDRQRGGLRLLIDAGSDTKPPKNDPSNQDIETDSDDGRWKAPNTQPQPIAQTQHQAVGQVAQTIPTQVLVRSNLQTEQSYQAEPLYQTGAMYQGGSNFQIAPAYHMGSPYQAGSTYQTGSPYQAGSTYQTGSPYQAGSTYQTGSPYQAESPYRVGSFYPSQPNYQAGLITQPRSIYQQGSVVYPQYTDFSGQIVHQERPIDQVGSNLQMGPNFQTGVYYQAGPNLHTRPNQQMGHNLYTVPNSGSNPLGQNLYTVLNSSSVPNYQAGVNNDPVALQSRNNIQMWSNFNTGANLQVPNYQVGTFNQWGVNSHIWSNTQAGSESNNIITESIYQPLPNLQPRSNLQSEHNLQAGLNNQDASNCQGTMCQVESRNQVVSANQTKPKDQAVTKEQAVSKDQTVPINQSETKDQVEPELQVGTKDQVVLKDQVEPKDQVEAKNQVEPEDHVGPKEIVEPQDQAGPSQSSSSSNATQPAASDVSIEEKIEKAKELIEIRRREKEAKEKEEEKQKEMERRAVGQGVAELKKWQADQELKQIQEERKREKMENNLARQRILDQIAQDRAERKAREQPHSPPAVPATPPTTPAAVGDAGSRARVQFKLPNGETHTAHFPADALLSEVQQYVVENLNLRAGTFSLWTAFPRCELDSSTETLLALRLAPSAALLVLPRREPPSPATVTPFAAILAFITQIFSTYVLDPSYQIYSWLRNRIFPTLTSASTPTSSPAPSAPPSPRNTQQPPNQGLRRRGNIHRLPSDNPEDDDNNTWNGNSTQQM